MGATAATELPSSRSMAVASSRVRFCVAPDPVATPCMAMEPGRTISRFEPRLSICCATFACAPWPMETVAITAATAITIPSIASSERSLFLRSARSAVRSEATAFTPSAPAQLAAHRARDGGAPVPLARADALVEQRQLDVLHRGGAREEVEPLEHEPDLLAAHAGELIAREPADVASGH